MTTKDEIEKYELICKMDAPYPLNYLPYSDYPQIGILAGMLIDKGLL